MRPITTTVVGAVNGSTIPLDYHISPFQVAVTGAVASGSVSYKLQYTYDDVFNTAVTPSWTDSTVMVTKTAAFTESLTAPVTAVRVVNAGTGTVSVRITQVG